MLTFTRIRFGVLVLTLAFCCLSLTAGLERSSTLADRLGEINEPVQRQVNSAGTYFSLREDRRRCASPMCGGYFVKRINRPSTRCSDGKYKSECYVAEIDWNGRRQVGISKAILRGTIDVRTYNPGKKFGILKVTESWEASSNNSPMNPFYRVVDRGVRCITQPCPTYQGVKLNSTSTKNLAGIDLNSAGAEDRVVQETLANMKAPDGVIISGVFVPVTGPAGASYTIRADQFYIKSKDAASEQRAETKPSKSRVMKQCIRTGCSNQICADEEMMTTCEYKPQYDCYRQARCERQANGSCGFTRTPELLACLAKK